MDISNYVEAMEFEFKKANFPDVLAKKQLAILFTVIACLYFLAFSLLFFTTVLGKVGFILGVPFLLVAFIYYRQYKNLKNKYDQKKQAMIEELNSLDSNNENFDQLEQIRKKYIFSS